MIVDEVPVAVLQDLAARPGTVLVASLVDPMASAWTVRVAAPAEITTDERPVYHTSWGEPDEHGLCAEVRTYLTHREINLWLTRSQDWQLMAHEAWGMTEVVMVRHRRGDDALADELLDDPSAWAKYLV